MTRGKLLLGAALIIGAGVLVWRLRSRPASDEALLLNAIDEVTAAIERRDIKTVRRHLDRRYSDSKGRSYQDIDRLLLLHFLRRSTISVYVLSKDVALGTPSTAGGEASRTATTRLNVVLTRGAKVEKLPDILPSSARAMAFDLTWRKSDHWRVTAALWRPIRQVDQLVR